MNMFGAQNHLQCAMDAYLLPNHGMEDSFKINQTYDHTIFMNTSLLPGIRAIESCNGPTHGVMMQGHFWDIRNSFVCDGNFAVNGTADPAMNSAWLTTWESHMTSFVRVMKSHFQHTPYLSWRTPNPLPYNHSKEPFLFFRDIDSRLLQPMRDIAKGMAQREGGLDIIDFYSFPNASRRIDAQHPVIDVSIAL
eukprot:gene37450-48987_t